MLEKKNNREYNIDLLRIFSCIMIIALHETGFIYEYQLKWTCMQTIIRPCLWVFCSISGYYLLNNKDDIKTFYKKRLKAILIPLFVYTIVLQMLNNVFNNIPLLESLDFSLIKSIWSGANSGHLWFIYSIIGIYLITPFLKQMVIKLNNKELIILLTIIVFFVTINPILAFYGYSTTIDTPFANVMLLYYILGYYISKIKLDNKKFLILLFIEVINILSIILYFRNAPYIQSILYTSSINMIVSVIFIFELFKRIKVNKIFFKTIKYVSGRTYAIYIVHLFVLQQVSNYMKISYTKNNILYIVPLKVFIIFVISLLITIIVYELKRLLIILINKIKLYF